MIPRYSGGAQECARKMTLRKTAVRLSSCLAVVLCLPWLAHGQPGRAVDDTVLRDAGKSGVEWLTYGLNQAEQRYSPLKQIDTGNVGRLGLAWSYDVGTGGGQQEDTPLVWNNTIYGITNFSIVFAVDARTGKEKWRWDPEVNRATVPPKLCCGIVNRGLAIYEGRIIAPINDGRLVALDAITGKPVWEARVAYPQDNYTLTMAPRIAKGKVVIGVAGAEWPVRGFFAAYDARTGAFAWRDYTVPGDPTKPFENEAMRKASATWDNAAWKMGGGGSVWDGMAYDPDLNLLYVGTGNPGPWPDQIRKSNGRDNLYADSILAVNPDNGEMKWYFQAVPDDSWDFDSVAQLLLADLTIKGQRRKVIMQANKNGFFYVIDRTTGQFISGQPFVRVTWAKGLDEKTGRPFVNKEAHYGANSVYITPGAGGAHNWSPMSFNPTTGLVYVPSSNGGFGYAVDENFKYDPKTQNLGLALRAPAPARAGRGGVENVSPEVEKARKSAPAARPAAPKPVPPPPAIGPAPAVQGGRGQLRAWDPVTQQARWSAPEGTGTGGGTLSTAGNLLFQVTNTGHLIAYSADKGVKLLDINTGLRSAMGPPITYEIDGKQYVALMGGIGIVEKRFNVGPAPNVKSHPILPKLLVFEVDGKAALPDAPK
jgi:quinohemoprotein ethanol dehydrogenase